MRQTKHAWPGDDQLVAGIVAAGGPNKYAQQTGIPVGTVYSRLDKRRLRGRVLEQCGGRIDSAVAAAREIAEQTLRQAEASMSRAEKPSVSVKGDSATLVAPAAPELGDMETLMRERGLNPDEWEVANAVLNEWDGMAPEGQVQKLRQLKLHLRRKMRVDWLFPASDVAQRPAPVPTIEEGEPQRIVFFPDQHAPYQDEGLHNLAMCHLVDWQPHRIVNLGDICDFATISRHRDNPAYFASATASVDGAMGIINDQRTAAPNALIDLIEGNHDARPRTELLSRAERMYDLRPGMLPGDDVPAHPWSLQHLLSLDRFHVNFVGPELEGDNYFHGLLEVTPDIAAIHGFLTGAGSEKATAERLGMSVVFGHIHSQVVRHVTKYKGRERAGEFVAISPGTMRATRGGGGFAWNPNWQQGYLTATVWPDGQWTYDMARFDGHRLTWRDKRFS